MLLLKKSQSYHAPARIPRIAITHHFHGHNFTVLLEVISECFLGSLPREATHEDFGGIYLTSCVGGTCTPTTVIGMAIIRHDAMLRRRGFQVPSRARARGERGKEGNHRSMIHRGARYWFWFWLWTWIYLF